jgi:hypothetical protein
VHSIDESWKELWLVGAEAPMVLVQVLKRDWKFYVTGAHNILDLEFLQLHICETHFLDHLGIPLGSNIRLFLTLGTCDDHLTRVENEGSGFRVSDTDDHCCKTLRVILSISATQCDFPKVKQDREVGSRDNVLEFGTGFGRGLLNNSCLESVHV